MIYPSNPQMRTALKDALRIAKIAHHRMTQAESMLASAIRAEDSVAGKALSLAVRDNLRLGIKKIEDDLARIEKHEHANTY